MANDDVVLDGRTARTLDSAWVFAAATAVVSLVVVGGIGVHLMLRRGVEVFAHGVLRVGGHPFFEVGAAITTGGVLLAVLATTVAVALKAQLRPVRRELRRRAAAEQRRLADETW